MKILLFLMACATLLSAGAATDALARTSIERIAEGQRGYQFARDYGASGDVPFVPTGEALVEAMLRLANVGPSDVVYDLGCGDGRIAIMAAKRFGARAIGIDINPERIQDCNKNARKANVMEKVEFKEQDLFNADIRNATVVTLYLLPSVNLRLRPKLLSELKPGTRIVSHSFSMGDWAPDKSESVGGYSQIHYWVVPANASGAWRWSMPSARGQETVTLELTQKFQKVGGTLNVGGRRIPIQNATLVGDHLDFSINQPLDGQSGPQHFTARINGDSISGMMGGGTPGDAGGGQNWNAQRTPGSATPLDASVV